VPIGDMMGLLGELVELDRIAKRRV
jgi:hypothetical protein